MAYGVLGSVIFIVDERSCSVRYRFASSHFSRCDDSRSSSPWCDGVRLEGRREAAPGRAADEDRRCPALTCVLWIVSSFLVTGSLSSWAGAGVGATGEIGGERWKEFLRMPVAGCQQCFCRRSPRRCCMPCSRVATKRGVSWSRSSSTELPYLWDAVQQPLLEGVQ